MGVMVLLRAIISPTNGEILRLFYEFLANITILLLNCSISSINTLTKNLLLFYTWVNRQNTQGEYRSLLRAALHKKNSE